MMMTVYILMVITVVPGNTHTLNFKEYKTADECLQAANAIDVNTMSFTKCVPKEIKID